jgi:uncharacterized protein YcfL
MRKTALLPLAGLALLAACGSKETEEPATDNDAIVEEPANIVELNEATAPAPENVTNEVRPAAPPKISEEQQTLDDADATGLTSRLSQDDAHAGHGDAANQAAPVAQ